MPAYPPKYIRDLQLQQAEPHPPNRRSRQDVIYNQPASPLAPH